jgi:superfamily II DNA/RNA helicase
MHKKGSGGKKVLVFCDSAESAGKTAGLLQEHKIAALPLFSRSEGRNLAEFTAGNSVNVLAATDLASRGLDIQGVRFVINYEMPPGNVHEAAETYIHRAGRTARCGRKGVVVTIGDERELRRLSLVEKELGICVQPKVLQEGRLLSPEEAGYGEEN